jgi:hypothetical protein
MALYLYFLFASVSVLSFISHDIFPSSPLFGFRSKVTMHRGPSKFFGSLVCVNGVVGPLLGLIVSRMRGLMKSWVNTVI